ncbi:MAG: sugar phosphate isomerase/epimerase family protein [Eubacteriales bacterium]|nr:sugar phosphate isomerase/epimerase family protein [Eubacteriales bacterium]
MKFSIIPEYSDLKGTLALSEKYDVNLEYNDFWMPGVYDNEAEIVKRIEGYKSLSRNRSGDTLHGAFLGLDIAAIDPVLRKRSRDLIVQSVEIAKELGVKGVIFHSGLIGTLRLDYYLNHWLEEATQFFGDLCRKNPGLIIYMENSFEQEPDIFVRLMEQMKDVPNFKLCLDYARASVTPTPTEVWMKKLSPFIGHMHLNDNDLHDDLHLVPGEGKIDYHKYLKLMEENHIDVSVLLEIRGLSKAEAALQYMNKLLKTPDDKTY